MDARVTAKFFRIQKPTPEAPSLDSVLNELLERDLVNRELELDEKIVVRLERLEPDPNYLSGEFCRIQHANIPPSAGPDGLKPTVLPGGRGLGHLAAFRYHVPTRVLLLQMNQNCASASRISLYLSLAGNVSHYVLEPVLRKDALKRVGQHEIKAFTVKFAEPENMAALDNPALSALKGVKHAAELLHAHQIEITVSAGPKRKKKAKPLMLQAPVRKLLSKLSQEESVEKLEAQIDEDEEAKWIDILEDQAKYSEVLDLPSDDSDDTEKNYTKRKNYLIGIFNDNIKDIKEIYGKPDGNN